MPIEDSTIETYRPRQGNGPAFVLVPGAWCGAWCWTPVAERLRQRGCHAYPLTLTGLGERSHLLSRDISLHTHALDVANAVRYEDLEDVVLVGHSYAGLVLTAAAEIMADRLRHIIYIDAMLPFSGECGFDLIPPEDVCRRRCAAEHDGGVSMPVPKAGHFTVSGMKEWFFAHMTPQPLRPYEDRLELKGLPGNGVPATFIACTPSHLPAVHLSRTRAARLPGWNVLEIASGHNVHLHRPDDICRMLIDCSRKNP